MEENIWKQMYLVVAAAAADAAELMETAPHDVGAWTGPNRALQKAEEIYLSAGETDGDKA